MATGFGSGFSSGYGPPMTWSPDYATINELRLFLRLDADGNTDGASPDDDNTPIYGAAITAASRAIDRAAGRQFGQSTLEARYYRPEYRAERARNVVIIDDLMTDAGLVVKTDLDGDGVYETTITDYRKLPPNGAATSRPWTMLELREPASTAESSLEVTASWGWATVPTAIHEACLIQAARLAKRRDAPFGVAGSPDLGSELRLLSRLDPDVAVLVGAYRRIW